MLSWLCNNKAAASVRNYSSCVLARLTLAAFLGKNCIAEPLYGENTLSVFGRGVPGPPQGKSSVVFLCNIRQCRGLHLNKAAHSTELFVRLAFRNAVNAFLLMRRLKVPAPRKKSMWGEYNADYFAITKGHCIRKPYLCCVTFGCPGEPGWIPADT